MDKSFVPIPLGEGDKFVVGLKQTMKALASDKTVSVYLAQDCDGAIRDAVTAESRRSGARITPVATMKQLGRMCAIVQGASCAAVLHE